MKKENVEVIVELAQGGNEAALNKLCSMYNRVVFNALFYKCKGNRELAEDLTQDVMIKMVSSLGQYSSNEFKFATWLSKITNSVFIDDIRYNKSRVNNVTTLADFSLTDASSEEADINSNFVRGIVKSNYTEEIETCFIKNEANMLMRKEIMDAIDSLDNIDYKRVIALHLFSDMSYDEISEKIGMNLNNVKVSLYRGKNEIMKKIASKYYNMSGSKLAQNVVKDYVVNNVSVNEIAKKRKVKVNDINNIIESGLKNIFRSNFVFEETLSEELATTEA